ncbi:MAG: YqgE/AlgH family protein [Nitrospirae bacterium]|nr:MAG: YqgE/AlgH family protein [Nitrospirota bacterium]
MTTPLSKGIFLIATPGLRDPNFRQTVVLLCEYGEQGALGVIVNRPTEISISEVLPQAPVLESQCHRVFAGGPVQRNNLLILFRLEHKPPDTHHVIDGVYLGGDMETLDRVLKQPSPNETFRAFMGYSGWAPGQLENEIEMGSWFTKPADPVLIFEKDPSRLWADILKTIDEKFSIYADMPLDPSLN